MENKGRYTKLEKEKIYKVFSTKNNLAERKLLSEETGRSIKTMYSTYKNIKNSLYPKRKPLKRPLKRGPYNKTVKHPVSDIVVTHVDSTIKQMHTIKIGECVVETYSSKIKINSVLIEL